MSQEKVRPLPEQIASLNMELDITKAALLLAYKMSQEIEEANKRAEVLERQAEEDRKRADIDDLTGVYRRDGFIKAASEPTISQSRVKGSKRHNSLLMIDVDDFTNINTTFGHNAGDMVLKDLADRMKSAVRKDDIVGRWGGDEFVVFLPETTETRALKVGKKLIESTKDVQINGLKVNFSVGAAEVPKGNLELGLQIELGLQDADKAMYAAKDAGKNQVVGHSSLQKQLESSN